jgi:hypothetical protein
MTFNQKLTLCFQNFENISKPDFTRKQVNYFADFVELVTLLSNDDGITNGDIQDRFYGEKDYLNAKQRDNDEAFILEIFILIEQRSILYKENYPFNFNESDILGVKKVLSNKNKLYLSLLISSQLKIFDKFQPELTSEFEQIAENSLIEFLPSKAIIKSFGKNTEFRGNAISKIKQLASHININVDEYELGEVSERNMQERGLDVVGWIPFDDNCQNKIVYLGQCACGKGYESKQHDTRRFENYFLFYKTKPQHVLFIPYSLINYRVKKFHSSDIIEKDYLVFERKRLIEYSKFVETTSYLSFRIVNSCVNYSR